ncbi:NAD-dependent epimerase/dehydratase family protein [Actinopolymorpha pittospori]
MTVVALLGAGGFVGSAVRGALEQYGHAVKAVSSPRLSTSNVDPVVLIDQARRSPELASIVDALTGADVVVNAAGVPDASSLRLETLVGANALLPRLVLEAASRARVRRMVHVSSAVVQSDRAVLDASEEMAPFSPYSTSKVLGEQVLRADPPAEVSVVRFRPPSVHASGRRVSRRIARIAASPVASVARPGSQPSPQALLPNVASAIAFLATCVDVPPAVVTHPWEGLTSASLMETLGGGRRPLMIPRTLARGAVGTGRWLGRLSPAVAANVRRLEVLWLGQEQARSWLEVQGWGPPVGAEGWHELANSSDATSGDGDL